MTFKAAKCPNCAGDIQVPDDRDTVKCMYCGSDIIVRDAIKAAAGGVNVENLLMLAKTAEESRKYEEAYKYYSAILEHDARNVNAWIGKGITCAASGGTANYNLAEGCFKEAIKVSTSQQDTRDIIICRIKEWFQDIESFLSSSDYSTYYRYLEIIHELNPDDIVGLIGKATTSLYTDQSQAIQFYKKALDVSMQDKQIAKLIASNIACQRIFNNIVELNRWQAIISFVHVIYPDDRPIEKRLIQKICKEYQYRRSYDIVKNEKEVFHKLLREAKQVDARFNCEIPDCLKSGWFS